VQFPPVMKNLKIDPTTKCKQNYWMQGEFFVNKKNLDGKKLACQKSNHQDSQEFFVGRRNPNGRKSTCHNDNWRWKKEFLELKIVNCINFCLKYSIYHHIVNLIYPCEMWETLGNLDETKTSWRWLILK